MLLKLKLFIKSFHPFLILFQVVFLLTLAFICFTLPYEIYTSHYNFSQVQANNSLYYEGFQLVLKVLKLCSFVFYFLCFVTSMKRLRLSKLKYQTCFLIQSTIFCRQIKEFDLTDKYNEDIEMKMRDVYKLRT